jgi:pimeloyl-ACP methyl ester carboxylesterase
MDEFIEVISALGGRWWSPMWDAMQRANDLAALTAMLKAEEGILSFGLGESVSDLTVPTLFLVGEAEPAPDVKAQIERIPNAEYVGFPDLGHVDMFCRSDLVLSHVRRFLAKVGES